MSDVSDYHSIPDQSASESASASHLPKPSGMKQPTGIPSFSKINRICSHHEKKPDLPISATPKKSEYPPLLIFSVAQKIKFTFHS